MESKERIIPTREELIELINKQARQLRKADYEIFMYWGYIEKEYPEVADVLKYIKQMIHDGHWAWIDFINKHGKDYE